MATATSPVLPGLTSLKPFRLYKRNFKVKSPLFQSGSRAARRLRRQEDTNKCSASGGGIPALFVDSCYQSSFGRRVSLTYDGEESVSRIPSSSYLSRWFRSPPLSEGRKDVSSCRNHNPESTGRCLLCTLGLVGAASYRYRLLSHALDMGGSKLRDS